MDKLPKNVLARIFDFLSMEDILNLSFMTAKCYILAAKAFQFVEQVKLQFEPEDNLLADRSFVAFRSKKLVNLHFHYNAKKESIINFLVRNCPNLKVLDAPTCCIKKGSLILCSKKLKYFSCLGILEQEVPFESGYFAELEGCDILDPGSAQYFREKLRYKLSKSVNLFMEEFRDETVMLNLLPSSLKSLRIITCNLKIQLPEFLAQSLRVLQLQGVTFKASSHLPNLQLLKVSIDEEEPSKCRILKSVAQSKELKVFSIKVAFTSEMCDLLSKLFTSWPDLEFLNLIDQTAASSGENVTIYLPQWTNIHTLTLSVKVSVVFLSEDLTKLTNLHIKATSVAPVTLKYPNLVTFQMELDNNQFSYPILMSLSKCKLLKSVQMDFVDDLIELKRREIGQLMVHELPFSGISSICVGVHLPTDEPYSILKFKWPYHSKLHHMKKNPFNKSFGKSLSMVGTWQVSLNPKRKFNQIIATLKFSSMEGPFCVRKVIRGLVEGFANN